MTEEKDKLQTRKERYLRDPLPVRLGNLASNLSRMKSFARHTTMADAARKVVYESENFIEWTAADATIEVQVELVELQRLLAGWQLGWDEIWAEDERRGSVAAQADAWAKRILERSGLLPPVVNQPEQQEVK
ncbi:MAG: hypothetical protein ACREEM_35175 [Blastocatellia bacterium]